MCKPLFSAYQKSGNNITSQHEDKTYLVDDNGCCQIINNKHCKLEKSTVRNGNGEKNAKLKQIAAGDLHTAGLTGKDAKKGQFMVLEDQHLAHRRYMVHWFTAFFKNVVAGLKKKIIITYFAHQIP